MATEEIRRYAITLSNEHVKYVLANGIEDNRIDGIIFFLLDGKFVSAFNWKYIISIENCTKGERNGN